MNECEINNTRSHNHILLVENVQTLFDQNFRCELLLEQKVIRFMDAYDNREFYSIKYQQFDARSTDFLFRFNELYYFHSDGYFTVVQLVVFHVFRNVDFVNLGVTPTC